MTIYCPSCATANRDGSSYCNNCGQRLTEAGQNRCPQCGAHNLPGAVFCQQCGTRLPEPAPTEPDGSEDVRAEDEAPEAEVTSLEALHVPEQRRPAATEAGPAEQAESGADEPAGSQPSDAMTEDRTAGAGAGTGEPAGGGEDEEGGRATAVEASEPLALDRLTRVMRPAWGEPLRPLSSRDLLERLSEGLGPVPSPSIAESAPTAEAALTPLLPPVSATPSPAETFAAVAAAAPEKPVAAVAGRGPLAVLGPWLPRLLSLTLLAAVALPFLVGGEWSGSTIPLNLATANLFETVGGLRPGSPVLVAFDYDPGTEAELDPQARAVLAHLMQRGARIVAVSLLPQGPAMAEAALRATAPGQAYRYGDDYINLGYVAGEDSALATMGYSLAMAAPRDYAEARPVADRPVLQDIRAASDFALVIVFCGDEVAARRWLTQIQGRYGVKMVAGVSAIAAPQMEPFLQGKQLSGLLAGLPGAAEYELLLNQPGNAVRMLDAQSLAHGVIVGFVLLGNLGYVVLGLRSSKRRASV